MGFVADQIDCTATGQGVSKDATGDHWQHFTVWRDSEGQWWMAHPTDARGRAVRYDGEVRDVEERSAEQPK
jgi:hypothetical protein